MLTLRRIGEEGVWTLADGIYTLGRGEDCQIRANDPRVSRHHASLEIVGPLARLKDLASRNGVFVNGAKVADGVLRTGDRLALGPAEFLLGDTSADPEALALPDETCLIRERGRLGAEALPSDTLRLQVLYRVASELVSSLRLQLLLPRVLDALAELFRYDRCAIVVRGSDGHLAPLATRPEGLPAPYSRTVASRVADGGEALLFDDIQGQKGFDLSESVIALNIRSVLCAPLAARGRILGLVYLDRTVAGAYDAEDLALLRSVSSMVAIAVENARLYAEVEGRYEETAKRLRVLEAHLIETERAAALGQLALTVADEVRNPVTVIGGLARRLRRELGEPALEAAAGTIQEEAERLERMMGRVEALVALPAPVVEPRDLRATVAAAVREVEPLLEKGGVSVQLEQGGAPEAAVPHDPALTRIALNSVLEHSCRYLAKGSVLRVGVRREEGRRAVAVEDGRCAGQALPLHGVFEVGASGEPWSLDLGLALAERAMVAQGGDLRLAGHAGTGICAYLLLPLESR